MKYNKRKLIISWILVIIWMVIILSFSNDTAEVSKEKSSLVVEKIEPIVEKVTESISDKPYDREILVFIVRKCAHIFNFIILYLFNFNAFSCSVNSRKKTILYSILLTLVFSCLDEYYQTFIPGRGGQISDVLIDGVGIAIGGSISNTKNKYW